MNPRRRRWLLGMLGAATALPAAGDTVQRGRALVFPRDHGAHPAARTEWWYATGWLGTPQAPSHGFQVTFFRSRTGLAEQLQSRFAARQLLFAHAALTDLERAEHRHDQRIVRWTGDGRSRAAGASSDDSHVWIGDWSLQRSQADAASAPCQNPARAPSGQAPPPGCADVYRARVAASGFSLQLDLDATQPLLLQGDAGYSRKGPEEHQASHYTSAAQLAARGVVGRDDLRQTVQGRAWLDHEWSDELLAPGAVGWDWIGMNLFDGSALTAFRLRRADGSPLWAGGSHRAVSAAARAFAPDEVRWQPGRQWRSPSTGAQYPVQWDLQTPAGRHQVRALLDAQELDSRTSTGTVYWEGLSELLDGDGRRVGLGYLEMTGYAGRLRLG